MARLIDGPSDFWEWLRLEIEREYWETQRKRLSELEFVTAMADEMLKPGGEIIPQALGGEWDYSEHRAFAPRGPFRAEPPKTRLLRAVCRRELKNRRWEIQHDGGGLPWVILIEIPLKVTTEQR